MLFLYVLRCDSQRIIQLHSTSENFNYIYPVIPASSWYTSLVPFPCHHERSRPIRRYKYLLRLRPIRITLTTDRSFTAYGWQKLKRKNASFCIQTIKDWCIHQRSGLQESMHAQRDSLMKLYLREIKAEKRTVFYRWEEASLTLKGDSKFHCSGFIADCGRIIVDQWTTLSKISSYLFDEEMLFSTRIKCSNDKSKNHFSWVTYAFTINSVQKVHIVSHC